MIYVYRQIWRGIAYSPDYEVSNYGQVKSWKRKTPHILMPGWGGPKRCKYLHVGLGPKCKRIHLLVLETFKGLRPEGMQACHNNGKRWDNSIWNLRWDTPKNNQADRIKHETSQNGERNRNAKLKNLEVLEIRRLSSLGIKKTVIGKMFKMHQTSIGDVVNGKGWKHLTPETT